MARALAWGSEDLDFTSGSATCLKDALQQVTASPCLGSSICRMGITELISFAMHLETC